MLALYWGTMSYLTASLEAYFREHQQRFLEELCTFLQIPSVSTLSEQRQEVSRAADFVVQALEQAGLQAQRYDTAGHPVVYAEAKVGDHAPTVLIYGHYDVQPADPLELWTYPPFAATIADGYVYARGAADDKGQVYAHIKAAEALLANDALNVNVKFLLEGEEEIGSPHLGAFLRQHQAMLACDAVLISDTTMLDADTPSIVYGLKGMSFVELRVEAANRDVHSGEFGGGIRNPLNGLAKIIASLHDDQGRIAVEGFYDDVLPLADDERQAFAALEVHAQELIAGIGASATPGEAGYSFLERIWARPTLDVNGMAGGFQGEGNKTIIPAKAMAKISCRLVPWQRPEDIAAKLQRHIKAVVPTGLQLELINSEHGAAAVLTPRDAPAVQLASQALAEVYPNPPAFMRMGGSIPIVSSFQQLLSEQVVLAGFSLSSDCVHAPDERFGLQNFQRGIAASAAMLRAMAELPRD